MGWSSIPKVPKIGSLQRLYNISKKKLDIDFDKHADKHQSFPQIGFDTLGIKVSYKVRLSILISIIKHSQSTQSNKFTISL